MNFCTLFDSNYILQGLSMYQSLEKVCGNFHLYILAFDDLTAQTLASLKLVKATIITAKEFEDEKLYKIKITRSRQEYYWTCTPSLILYTLKHFNLTECTYLDADLLFFQNPQVLLDELGDDSILITEHRYHPRSNKIEQYGKYCVQFNTFKNNADGLKALNWWRDRCNEWCSIVPQDNKFGDQKYLDDWQERFKGVHELKNLGGGVAPWNVLRYKFHGEGGKVWGQSVSSQKNFELVFYHFHRSSLYNILGKLYVRSYHLININKSLQDLIYLPYTESLAYSMGLIKTMKPNFPFRFEKNSRLILEKLKDVARLVLCYLKR